MSRRINIALVVTCIAILAATGTVWFARGQTTNVPEGFRAPLVRDLELVNSVQALNTRVEALEAKVKALEAGLQSVEGKSARNN